MRNGPRTGEGDAAATAVATDAVGRVAQCGRAAARAPGARGVRAAARAAAGVDTVVATTAIAGPRTTAATRAIAGRRAAFAALGALAFALAACAGAPRERPVAFQPRTGGDGEVAVASSGPALRAALAGGVVLTVRPTWRRQPLDAPAFALTVANGSPRPVRLDREAVQATFRGVPVALARREERLRAVRAAEARGEALQVAVGTVAAVAALWGIASGWDGVVAAGSGAGTVAVQTPLTGLVAGVAIAGAGEEAVERASDGLAARRALAEAVLATRTLAPGESATVQLVLDGCCDAALRNGDVVAFAIDVAGETARFAFQRVPADDPTRLLPP